MERKPDSTERDDRRRKRSNDPLIALHYQLAHARHDGDLEAIVLADTAGVVVAGAGSWAACEELAAYAPLLVQGVWTEPGSSMSSRVAEMRMSVEIQTVNVDGQEVYLCARGGYKRGVAVEHAAKGVCRILSQAA